MSPRSQRSYVTYDAAGKSYLPSGVYSAVTRRPVLLLVFWLSVCLCGSARAQALDPTEALLSEGYTLREQGQDDLALAKFEQAYALGQQPRALAQIALAQQALGRWSEAEVNLSRALEATGDPWIDGRRLLLEQSLRTIASELGSLEIACNIGGAAVEIAGRPVGQTPLVSPLRTSERMVEVSISAESYFPLSQRVNVPAGQLTHVDLVLLARPSEAAAALLVPARPGPIEAAPSTRADGDDRRKRRWLLASVGSVVVVGVVAGILASRLKRDDESSPNLGSTGRSLHVPAMQPGGTP